MTGASRPGEEPAGRSQQSGRWPYTLAVAVIVGGLLVTATLTLVSVTTYRNNEDRLLDLRVKELTLLFGSATSNVQTPLASAAALASATNGDLGVFRRVTAPEVGAPPSHRFASVSLWKVGSGAPRALAALGTPPALGRSPARLRSFLGAAVREPKMSVIGFLTLPRPRLGYAITSGAPGRRFAVYGEAMLPADRRSRLQSNSAFSDLDYAIYLGRKIAPGRLLLTSLAHPPITGRQARAMAPFGNMALTVVVSPRRALGGSFPQTLPWIIGVAGVLLTLALGWLTVRLIQRRRGAEDLAGQLEEAVDENQRLYAEQRDIAQTLQHALLPEDLPRFRGAEASALYEPGEGGVDIGGDWYDVIPTGDHQLLVVVGDVSGHGLSAAATMASLRYAIHAYAAQDDPPATILTKLSRLLSVATDHQLATVLFALVDLSAGNLSVTSAGHLPPLLISDGGSEYVESEVGPPIGVEDGAAYASRTVAVPPAATVLAFTDGLVERRGESIDCGLERLRERAMNEDGGLSELLARLVGELRLQPAKDDTAIVGLRWSD